MSFEGRYQNWCPNGHYWEQDVYADDTAPCPYCGEISVIKNMVDDTNGEADGYITPIVQSVKKCEHCGSILEVIHTKPCKDK